MVVVTVVVSCVSHRLPIKFGDRGGSGNGDVVLFVVVMVVTMIVTVVVIMVVVVVLMVVLVVSRGSYSVHSKGGGDGDSCWSKLTQQLWWWLLWWWVCNWDLVCWVRVAVLVVMLVTVNHGDGSEGWCCCLW